MSKRKILTLAMAVMMVAILAVGGSLAYFMDTDNETNVFTVGNVEIDLIEDFVQNSKLYPNVDVNKDVFVKNTGSENAYVRVHVAFPTVLDDGMPGLDASKNSLHWNFSADSVQEGKWSQLQNSTQVGPNANYPNWPGNGGTYNTYTTTVEGVDYNVYVITYETVLSPGETTPEAAITNVYLDAKVTNEMVTEFKKVLGENWKILVWAEGGQEASFTDPYVALNTQFGDPMAAGYVSPWNQ